MNDRELIKRLKEATEGLLWLSESDYPWEVVYLEGASNLKSQLLEISNLDADTTIETKELNDFFRQATTEKDWYDDAEKAECQSYRELVEVLQYNLNDIKVYRLGETEVNCYVLGKTQSDAIAGLFTIAVET